MIRENIFPVPSRFAISVLSGVLLGAAYDYPRLLFPVLLLAPAFFLYVLLQKVTTRASAFLHGWFFGGAFIAVAIVWFWDTLPLDWLGIQSGVSAVTLVFLSWALVSLVLSLSVGVFAVAVFELRRQHWALHLISVPVLWVLAEQLRLWCFSLLTAQPPTSPQPYFSVGFLGYALAEHPLLLQLAKFGGVYMLSFIVVFISTGIYLLYTAHARHGARYAGLFFAGVPLLVVFGTSFVPLSLVTTHADSPQERREIKVAALHTEFPARFFLSGVEESHRHHVLSALLKRVAQETQGDVDIVVLPEDLRFLTRTPDPTTVLKGYGFRGGTLFVDSSLVRQEDGTKNTEFLFFSIDDGVIARQDKILLVPFGEYLPYSARAILTLAGVSSYAPVIQRMRARSVGEEQLHPVTHKEITVGAFFCSEIFSPSLSRGLVNAGAQLLVNTSSQSWFHGSKTLRLQTRRAAQVRAVANNAPLVVAGNSSPSLLINMYGRVLSETTPESGAGVLYGSTLISR